MVALVYTTFMQISAHSLRYRVMTFVTYHCVLCSLDLVYFSATYSRVHPTAGYISPNMSRRSVHGSSTSLVAPVPVLRLEDSPESDISSFTSVSQQHQSSKYSYRESFSIPVCEPARLWVDWCIGMHLILCE